MCWVDRTCFVLYGIRRFEIAVEVWQSLPDGEGHILIFGERSCGDTCDGHESEEGLDTLHDEDIKTSRQVEEVRKNEVEHSCHCQIHLSSSHCMSTSTYLSEIVQEMKANDQHKELKLRRDKEFE